MAVKIYQTTFTEKDLTADNVLNLIMRKNITNPLLVTINFQGALSSTILSGLTKISDTEISVPVGEAITGTHILTLLYNE